ncbi:cytochrome b [Emcibacter sp. SYSU 3D8]|uniref:cytochrome b n=1 Tax=Emcibacter sp. SYSU 3D8 TaxID=3133969 RepID=UPI0031FE80C0
MTRYSAVAITLHWLIALAVGALVVLGIVMTGLPDAELARKFALYQWHKSIGITVLLLSLLRLAWRLTHRAPPLPPTLKPWERIAARATHIGFYGLIILIPLLGWAMVSASPYNIPTVLYGQISWPHLPVPKSMFGAALAAHVWLAFGAVALLVLHVAAALKHHFILKDDVLARMVPFLRPPQGEQR